MKFASIRLVSNDLERLVAFYTRLTGVPVTRLAPEFVELRLEGATVALTTPRLIERFNAGAAMAAANQSVLLEFQVDDVDGVCACLADAQLDYAMPPTDMPWGNRSMLIRDPDGNLVNVFSRPKAQG